MLSGAISTSFGCSIDGIVPLEQVVNIIFQLRKLGIQEISLSDTTGMANPLQVYEYGVHIKNYFLISNGYCIFIIHVVWD